MSIFRMSIKKTVLVTLLIVATTVNVAFASVSSIWSARTDRPYYYIGGDRISLGVIRFDTNNWRDTDYISRRVVEAPKMNFLWDDKWYYEILPDSTNELLVLFWKNHDTKGQGWLAIKNTPDTWFYRTNGSSWRGLKDGQKVNEYWKRFGTRNTGDAGGSLSIDVRNPENRDGWTANHIQVSFGK